MVKAPKDKVGASPLKSLNSNIVVSVEFIPDLTISLDSFGLWLRDNTLTNVITPTSCVEVLRADEKVRSVKEVLRHHPRHRTRPL